MSTYKLPEIHDLDMSGARSIRNFDFDAASICKLIMNSSADRIMLFGADGQLEYINASGLAALGTETVSLSDGPSWIALCPGARGSDMAHAISRALSGQIAKFVGVRSPADVGARDWEVTVSSVHDPEKSAQGPRPLLVISRDVTLLKDAETRGLRSQRLETIGRLTSGVTHDFNNLLTVMMSTSEALASELPGGSEQHKLAVLGLQAAQRGADLVRRVLAFSQPQPVVTTTIDCGGIMSSARPLVELALHEDVALKITRPMGRLFCKADETELVSALLNLCINARDAMPAGGTIFLSAEAVRLCRMDARPLGLKPGPYVAFVIRDTGPGMSPATLARATEPFFTTKGPGGGTGLGLSGVHAFATQSDGALILSSEEGRGVTVNLYLPQVDGVDGSVIEFSKPPSAIEEGRLLLVEDDDAVREQVARQLRQFGYNVTEAIDGPAALALLACDKFDLLVTDMVMPNAMSGRNLVDRARIANPSLKVLLMSGYTQESETGDGADVLNFLAKPFRRAQLAAAVASAIAPPEVFKERRRNSWGRAKL